MAVKKNLEMELAWELAWRRRCCPPDNILMGSRDNGLASHLAVCTFCRDITDSTDEFRKQSEIIEKNISTLLRPRNRKVSPGQIMSVRKDRGGWGLKNRYYQPPLVLVIEKGEQIGGAVKVAQIHDERLFAAPGDVPIGGELGGYVEAWNMYSLRMADLDECWGEVNKEVLNQLRIEENKKMPNLPEDSLLYKFRKLELECGCFFSSRSVSEMMHDVYALDEALAYTDLSEAAADLAGQGALVPDSVDTQVPFRDFFFMVKPSEQRQLRLAASAEGKEILAAQFIVIGKGRIKEYGTFEIVLEDPYYDAENMFLSVEGRVMSKPARVSGWQWRFAWQTSEKQRIPAFSGDVFHQEERFIVTFRDIDRRAMLNGRLLVYLFKSIT